MKPMKSSRYSFLFLLTTLVVGLLSFPLLGSDWPYWRGPSQDGVSDETGLVSTWSPEGKNLIWRVDFVGRSTPVVMNGRVYVAGREGSGVDEREVLACYDARDGKLIWQKHLNVFLTTIPFQRISWGSPVGDVETGNVYFHGASGMLTAFDKDGNQLWEHSTTEEYGRYSGFGGRTPTPMIEGDLVVLNIASSGWGNQAPPRDRVFAFDKRTGELVWVATPGGSPEDLNTQSNFVAADINGQRLLIGGVGDGAIYALRAATGETVWSFQLSKRGLNAVVVVEGDRVYAAHSEENTDEASLGRVVCIDATGSGDVTATHELWRHDKFSSGFPSPAVDKGRVFVVSNSGNLNVLDGATGKLLWEHSLGTVGKGSPVVADGKLFVAEVNGAFHILDVGESGYKPLDVVHLKTKDGRDAEIYGSPAIAYHRIYFASEEGLYCVGNPETPFAVTASKPKPGPEPAAPEGAEAATLQVFPTELLLSPGQQVQLRARVFDAKGRYLREVHPEWTVAGFAGSVGSDGILKVGDQSKPAVGSVKAKSGGLEAALRVRAFPALPWSEDFESVELGKFPSHWIGAAGKFSVVELDGGKVLHKPTAPRGIQRSYVYVGGPRPDGYTVQADLKGIQDKRRVPDMGLIANRYIVALEGNYQRLSVESWAAEKRMAKEVAFPWEPDRWYTMKVQVDVDHGKAFIRAKVWPRDGEEPEAWSIEAEDPYPNLAGSPGIYGQSYSDIYYDNLKITGGKGDE